jgi:hypothetical protein
MSLAMLCGLLSRRDAVAGAPRREALKASYLEFPVILRRRVAEANWVIAEGPLGVIVEAIACLPPERRNEFTIGFAFPQTMGDRAWPEGQS